MKEKTFRVIDNNLYEILKAPRFHDPCGLCDFMPVCFKYERDVCPCGATGENTPDKNGKYLCMRVCVHPLIDMEDINFING